MNFPFFSPKYTGSRIARKLTFSIIAFSSLITLAITAIQLSLQYKNDLSSIYENIEEIRQNHLRALSHSVWILDAASTQIILDSLVKHQDIEQLKVITDGNNSWESGQVISKKKITHTMPLLYESFGQSKQIGTLKIVAGLDSIYQRLTQEALLILLRNGLKTFLVAFFSLFMIQRLVTRHLTRLADNAKAINSAQGCAPFSLDRDENRATMPDELDDVVWALNSMQTSLTEELIKLTETKEQLRKNNLLLNAVMDGTSDAIFIKDPTGRYLLANKAACEAIGKPHHEIIGKNDHQLFPLSSAQVIDLNDAYVLQEKKHIHAEERLETAYGDSYWLTKKSPYRDDAGNMAGLIGISRDITDMKNFEKEKQLLEERLSQAHKMEAVGTLAGGIAHDFNNILAAIVGYTELAQADAKPNSTLAADLEKIMASALRAKDLVQQILAFSRQNTIAAIPFQPASIIKEALKWLRASIPATIEIKEAIDPHCGMILADPTQLHQIIMNLSTNAFHAMEQSGGQLFISLKNIEATKDHIPFENSSGNDAFVELTVRDTGTGISSAIKKKIFDPYFTTKGIGKGTGMGLAIVQGIVQSYQGHISVESTPGEGSTFRVFFPITKQAAPAEAKADEPIPAGKERILLVDDEDFLIEAGTDFLERLGYSVTARNSSLAALQAFQNQPEQFDLVITDQTMPGMTGVDLSRRMLQIRPDIPIILCTGYSNLVDAQSAKAMGIKEFALKPLVQRDLAPLIRKALGS